MTTITWGAALCGLMAMHVGRYTVSFIGFLWDPARVKVLVEGA